MCLLFLCWFFLYSASAVQTQDVDSIAVFVRIHNVAARLYSRSVSRALLRARSLSRSLRWLRRDSVPVSVSRPSRLLTALALSYKTSVRLLMMRKKHKLPHTKRAVRAAASSALSVVISVCCYWASGENATHIICVSNSVPLAQIAVSLF